MSSKRPTQKDVAKLAHVSRGTVSLVLNNQSGGRVPISEETQQRVLHAAKELGYAPNPVAQMLARGTNRIIGVFTYERDFPYEEEADHHPYLIGIEHEASQQDYNVLLFTRHRTTGQHHIYNESMNSLRLADGAILLGSSPDRDELKRLAREDYSFVYIGRREVPGCDIDWVVGDYAAGSYEATRHLIELGHRRLGFVGYTPDTEASHDKLTGCQQAADETEGAELIVLPDVDLTQPDQLKSILNQHNVTALICREMWIFSSVLRLLEEIPVRLPEDISMLSLTAGNAGIMSTHQPTQLRIHRREIGKLAVRTLIARLDGTAQAPKQIRVPCELVIGNTTASIKK